ncbi:MAG: hypothetical protein PUF37_05385 [Prevotellaceae bacterium]|nr:hypothetical protein [Prevotellaceae bacterium]
MEYYIIPALLAERLSLAQFRTGSKEKGYLVNAADLSTIGVSTAVQLGAKYISAWEARKFIDSIKKTEA